MGLIFPTSPSVGQTYPLSATPGLPQYVWDGVTWVMKGSSINPQIYVADAAPSSPVDGALWWDSTQGILYLRYYDGDSRAWVQCAPSAADYAALQAYADVKAIKSDDNLIINGGMEVTQEYGAVAQVITHGGFKYTVDQWHVYVAGNGAMAFDMRSDSVLPVRGFRNTLRIYANPTAYNMAGANDLISLQQPIEGLRAARLGFGGAGALPVTISFWVWAPIAGTMTAGIRNVTNLRCYLVPVTVGAMTWEYKQITIPGDVAGTWDTTTNLWAYLVFTFGAGTTWHAAANTWNANANYAVVGTTNFFASNSNNVLITGVTMVAGNSAPSAAQSPLLIKSYDQEFEACLRYWEQGMEPQSYRVGAWIAGISNAYDQLPFLVTKRIPPAMSFTSWAYYNTGDATVAIPTLNAAAIYPYSFGWNASGMTNFKAWNPQGTWRASARL